MVVRRGDNGASTPTPILTDLDEDRRLFDAMPRYVRWALIESPYDYNCAQVWDAYRQTEAELKQEPQYFFKKLQPQDIWQHVLRMIELNNKEQSAKERQMYLDLVVELRFEKQQRIANVFLKSSSPA